jgi:hypothetical protein
VCVDGRTSCDQVAADDLIGKHLFIPKNFFETE